jgi:hypothetical protein
MAGSCRRLSICLDCSQISKPKPASTRLAFRVPRSAFRIPHSEMRHLRMVRVLDPRRELLGGKKEEIHVGIPHLVLPTSVEGRRTPG